MLGGHECHQLSMRTEQDIFMQTIKKDNGFVLKIVFWRAVKGNH